MTATPTDGGSEGTWAKLRRRKVVQWGLAYVAAAWGLLQGLEYVSRTFHWPEPVQQLTTLALLIGLPIVLVLAWYHGDRGEQRVSGTELAIVALLFLIGGALLWRYEPADEAPAVSGDVTAAQSAVPTVAPSTATPAPDAKSIAVLPFVDMSAEKNHEYMSDGIAEELLNLLAKAPELKVIARTSSFAFKGEKLEISEIARRLNVAHVLEGSVRTSGNKLRITAQLIRTADSTHLWSETYDRPLDDIFAVQDEIAGAIAQALQIRLRGGSLSRREGGTQNLEAYELYLQAMDAVGQYTEASLDAAAEYLEQAIKLDPGYGIAWDALAGVVTSKTDNYYLPTAEGYERARQLAQHALEVSPNLARAHVTLQNLYIGFGDWAAAEAEGQRALALAPTDPEVLLIAAIHSFTFGRWEDAERQLRTALVRDPANSFQYFNLGRVYYGAGRFAESEDMYRKALELAPGFLAGRAYLGKTLLLAGKPEAALAMVQQEADEVSRLLYLPVMLGAVGRQAEADEALNALIARGDDTAFYVAQSYAYRGDHDLAFQWLERAYRQKDRWLFEILGEHLFTSIADDPRYKAFLRRMKLPESPLVRDAKNSVSAAT